MSIVYVLTLVYVAGVCSASPVSRIVNGTPTDVERFPSIVQVDFFNPATNTWGHNCGGNILNELYILSAAHCTDPIDEFYSPENRRIRAGATYRNSGGIIRNVASVLNHPIYDIQSSVDADICIIRLAQLPTFGNGIRSIPIVPQDFVIPNNAPVIHAGWGAMGDTQGPPLLLLYVNLVHKSNCDGLPQALLTDNMVCAGSPTNGIKGACSADSGGPLYYSGVLAGVISWGAGCDTPTPTVSARVGAFTNWILENTP